MRFRLSYLLVLFASAFAVTPAIGSSEISKHQSPELNYGRPNSTFVHSINALQSFEPRGFQNRTNPESGEKPEDSQLKEFQSATINISIIQANVCTSNLIDEIVPYINRSYPSTFSAPHQPSFFDILFSAIIAPNAP